MNLEATTQSTARIAGRPIHPMPIMLLVATLVCDVLFYFANEPLLVIAARYALEAGILFAALAGLFGLIDYFGNRAIRELRAANIHLIGNVSILLLSIVYFMLRYSSAESVPASLVISTIVFVVIHITGWMGRTMVYRRGVGVSATGTA